MVTYNLNSNSRGKPNLGNGIVGANYSGPYSTIMKIISTVITYFDGYQPLQRLFSEHINRGEC
ncbi:unnamed protein product [Camellia sinensis]